MKSITEIEELFKFADSVGKNAVAAMNVTPMVVQKHSDCMDDGSPVVQSWVVDDGVCGFAWINIKPATSKFAKWMVFKGLARIDEYAGGVTYWIKDYNQSMQKKETYAHAFANALAGAGIKCYADSRMD
jgi:hypothetical protein